MWGDAKRYYKERRKQKMLKVKESNKLRWFGHLVHITDERKGVRSVNIWQEV